MFVPLILKNNKKKYNRKKRPLKHLKTFRQQLGVSQKDFALLIGCSHGQLAMAESKLRKLPLTPHAHVLLQHTPAITAAKNTTPATAVNKVMLPALKQLQKGAINKLVRQQIIAEHLEKVIAIAENMLAFAAIQQQQESLPELARMQLEVLRRQAGEKKARYQLRLFKCQLQVAGFEAMIAKAATLQSQL